MTAVGKNEICLIVYAPEYVVNDDRPLPIVQGMERAMPGLRLEWTISNEGKLLPVPQREEWLAQGRPDAGGFRLLCNDSEDRNISVTAWEHSTSFSPDENALLEIHVALPLNADGIAGAAPVLEAVGDASRAFWGHATPFTPGVDIARQTKNLESDTEPPPRGLPVLKSPSKMRLPEIPAYLGWLNYWSAATARAIGFPDLARDADLLSRSRRTAAGGWVVRLTDEALDLDIPAHLEVLKRTYERFPEIGGRSAS